MDRPAPLPAEVYQNRWTALVDRLVHFLARHWLLWLNLGVGLYAILPWISPLAQAWGWHDFGEAIFRAYHFLCHQSPALSYHVWGYPVAYCHRDTAIYTTILLAGLTFGLFRRRFRPLPWWVFFVSLVPMSVDGLTQAPRAVLPNWPLRTENRWAIALTGGNLPAWFYAGDAVGSLNWWLRLVSGVLFGLGLVLAVYPRVEAELRQTSARPRKAQAEGPSTPSL